MNKFIITILVFVMVAGFLGGCKDASQENTPVTDTLALDSLSVVSDSLKPDSTLK